MALYPEDATSLFTTSNFSSMVDRKPDNGYSTEREYSSVTFETEAGYEKRRLRSRRSKRSYSLKYSNITGLEKFAIENFYQARNGTYESFTLNLDHLNDVGNVTVRFEGPLKVEHVYSAGANALSNYYSISFKLKETYE